MRIQPLVLPALVAAFVIVGSHASAQVRRQQEPLQLEQRPLERRVLDAPGAVQFAPQIEARDLAAAAVQSEPPAVLRRAERRLLTRVSERLRHKDRSAAEKIWVDLLGALSKRDPKPNVNALVSYVLHHAYLEHNEDLKFYAEKVKFHGTQQQEAHALRDELTRKKTELERGGDRTRTVHIRLRDFAKHQKTGEPAVTLRPPKPMTVESVASELQGIVVLCNHIDKQSQLAQAELQNEVQEHQSLSAMMATASRRLHEAAKAAIQNMR